MTEDKLTRCEWSGPKVFVKIEADCNTVITCTDTIGKAEFSECLFRKCLEQLMEGRPTHKDAIAVRKTADASMVEMRFGRSGETLQLIIDAMSGSPMTGMPLSVCKQFLADCDFYKLPLLTKCVPLAKCAKKRKRKEVDDESDEEFPAEMLSSFLQSTIGQAFAHWSAESGYDVCAVSGQPTAFRKRLRAEVKKWRAAVIRVPKNGSAEFCRMPLSVEIGQIFILIEYCDFKTTLQLLGSCERMKEAVTCKWRLDANKALKPWSVSLPSSFAVFKCTGIEAHNAVGVTHFMIATDNCVLLFVKGGANHWLAAVFCDECHAAVIGWNSCNNALLQRQISKPLTTRPPVAVSMLWQTAVSGSVDTLSTNGEQIAAGTYDTDTMTLLNISTGDVLTNELNGSCVAFVGNERVVGLKEERDEEKEFEELGDWVLREYSTANGLSKEVLLEEVCDTESVIASENGKRLYVADYNTDEMLEYSTANWQLTARIPLGGRPSGKCHITSSGLLAQGIYRKGDYVHCIVLIECSLRCITQTIRTKHRLGKLTEDIDEINQVSFSPDSRHIVSVSDDSVQLFDALSGELIGEPRVARCGQMLAVCWLTDLLFVTLATASKLESSEIFVWHCAAQLPIARIGLTRKASAVLRISNGTFVIGSEDAVELWKLALK